MFIGRSGSDPRPRLLFLVRLIAMPLDGVEHAHTQHDNLERKEDQREPVDPIRHFNMSRLLLTLVYRGQLYAKIAKCNIGHVDADRDTPSKALQ
jgi:hypothetical protein